MTQCLAALEIHSLSQFATSVPGWAFKTLSSSRHTARTQCATISLRDTNTKLQTIHVLGKRILKRVLILSPEKQKLIHFKAHFGGKMCARRRTCVEGRSEKRKDLVSRLFVCITGHLEVLANRPETVPVDLQESDSL